MRASSKSISFLRDICFTARASLPRYQGFWLKILNPLLVDGSANGRLCSEARVSRVFLLRP